MLPVVLKYIEIWKERIVVCEKACYTVMDNIFEFFKEVMGDHIYNLGLDDAKNFYQQYGNNMEVDYYSLYKDNK